VRPSPPVYRDSRNQSQAFLARKATVFIVTDTILYFRSEWRHWLVHNVPGSGDVVKGDVAVEYVGAAPPKNSGFHRYCLFLFEQDGEIAVEDFIDATTADHRANTYTNEACSG
jgi:phosphatidylethanolamine-binding protein (PEBP) family uncharacterized protein